MILAFLLVVLVVGDAICSGVRSVVGRDAHLDLRGLVRAGASRGAAFGASVVVIAVASAAILGPADVAPGQALSDAAARGLPVLGPFGVLVGIGFVGYLGRSPDARCLAVAVVLGPCTLVRPLVLVTAGLAAGWSSPAGVRLVVAVVTGALLAAEPVLGRRMRMLPPAGLVPDDTWR